jgi:hypothetical protein
MARRTVKPAKPPENAEMRRPPAEWVRELLRAADRAALATALPAAAFQAWPYASLVLVAGDADGAPILLLSDLSEHARNIAADPRVSLLIDGTAGLKDPLTGPRATILGRAVRADDARRKARFLARHPRAKVYAGFKDFHLYRVEPARVHFVAGFGRIFWIDGAEIVGPGPGAKPKRLKAPAKRKRAAKAAARKRR